MDQLQSFKVTAMTGGPLLRLLLALRGEEPNVMNVDTAWEVFREFARLPTASGKDVISFQATWESEDSGADADPTYFVNWTREIYDDEERVGGNRAIQIQWTLEPDGDLGDAEYWSDDFDDIEQFFQTVEASAQFRALESQGAVVDIYTVDLND